MKQNIEKILDENKMIYLDTSVAMDEHFCELVDQIEIPLLERKMKIYVKGVVWAELLRHLSSDNYRKQRRATKAVELIGMHGNIFCVDEDELNSRDILRAFADVEFLAELTRNKRRYPQALLTNDKKLSMDVVGLNYQKSCNGNTISVYYLDKSGALIMDEIHEVEEPENEMLISDSELIEEAISCEVEKHNNDWLKTSLAIIVSFGVGTYIGKHQKELAMIVNKAIRSIRRLA